jgi:hypothetical protein
MLKLSQKVSVVMKSAAIAGVIGMAGAALSVAPAVAQHHGGGGWHGGGGGAVDIGTVASTDRAGMGGGTTVIRIPTITGITATPITVTTTPTTTAIATERALNGLGRSGAGAQAGLFRLQSERPA